jgi:hypothetical protein
MACFAILTISRLKSREGGFFHHEEKKGHEDFFNHGLARILTDFLDTD